jgi:excisionase family DNA binding protein
MTIVTLVSGCGNALVELEGSSIWDCRGMRDSPARRLYTVAEAALLLGIGRSTAYELLMRGELPCVLIGRRRMITAAALEDLLGERPPAPWRVKAAAEQEP